jgi:hypothetical protein
MACRDFASDGVGPRERLPGRIRALMNLSAADFVVIGSSAIVAPFTRREIQAQGGQRRPGTGWSRSVDLAEPGRPDRPDLEAL